MRRKRINIPFIGEESKLPLIEFRLEGEERLVALLDTGSESTLFDKSIPASESFIVTPTDYNMSLIGLSGETEETRVMSVYSVLAIRDVIGLDNMVEARGVLSDLSSVTDNIRERYGENMTVAAVLGSDFLRKYKAKIDYRKRKLTLR